MSAMLVSEADLQASGILWKRRSGRSKWPPCASVFVCVCVCVSVWGGGGGLCLCDILD